MSGWKCKQVDDLPPHATSLPLPQHSFYFPWLPLICHPPLYLPLFHLTCSGATPSLSPYPFSAHGPHITWRANVAVYFHGDTFSSILCQRQYYAGNIQVLTVKISDVQINLSYQVLAWANREEIVCERPAANETHEGEAAQSLIITPPTPSHPSSISSLLPFSPSLHPSIALSVSLLPRSRWFPTTSLIYLPFLWFQCNIHFMLISSHLLALRLLRPVKAGLSYGAHSY